METDSKLSCSAFPSDTTSSSKSGGVIYPCKELEKKEPSETPLSCSLQLSSTTSTSSSISTDFFKSECRLHKPHRDAPPNIKYELAIAKSVLKQYSTLSGDNLFDHLSDIIKRVIDERPPNVIDFFEEFSRNVREQKFHLPERFPPDAVFEESRLYRVAKQILISMKLPYSEGQQRVPEIDEEMGFEDKSMVQIDDLKLEINSNRKIFKIFNERVQQLQFYWNQCGFSIANDDIFQLACAMDRLQTHPSISQCRFWGTINGLKASYYIVEAALTPSELSSRMAQMQEEMRQKNDLELSQMPGERKNMFASHIGPELIPGNYGWENWPQDELAIMKPAADPVPIVELMDVFDVPPEPIGSGVNRYSYFVVNSLYDDWIELPIVTPKQIVVSRQIKKFLTGDLENHITAYPCFVGQEKHYLRAMIARITAGTFIAPRGYYRKMTKSERRQFEGYELDEEEEEEEDEEEEEVNEGEEEEIIDNDIVLLRNERYEPKPLNTLTPPANWLHIRPTILKQGRIVWFDLEKARKERERELARLLRLRLAEEMEEEEEEEEEEEGAAEDEELESLDMREIGKPILSPIDHDVSDEGTVPWVARFTSTFTNKMERVLVIQSNIWPGAYTFTFEKTCESIYMGWGHKYVARNIPFTHLPTITGEYPHTSEDFIEASDPSVEEEEAYRQYLLRKQRRLEARKKFAAMGEDELFDDENNEEGT